jgi:integrase
MNMNSATDRLSLAGSRPTSINDRSTLSQLPFEDAAVLWLKEHARYIKPRTHKDYQQYIRTLTGFFGGMILSGIDIGNVRAYQDWRAQAAGNQRINIELSTLQQVMREAGEWARLAEHYRPLPIDKRGSGRSITQEDEEKLLALAFARKRKLLAHLLRVMFQTGCGFGEIRHVKRRDVDLDQKMFSVVEGAKNQERERLIPLIPGAYESMQWLIRRWEYLGGSGQDEYILPQQSRAKHGRTDFYKPMTSIKRSWQIFKKEVTRADSELYQRIKDSRLYDCRVTAITRTLASGQVSVHTAKRLFGHVSEQMQRRYFKPDHQLLREAMELALGSKSATKGDAA